MSKTPRILAAALGVLALGACSPQATIAHVFGDRAGEATEVASCESSLDPGARSAGGGNHGLFQINNVHRGTFERVTGQPWSSVYDQYHNTVFAKWLFDQEGWSPWACKP
jgi:hypothetical protein